MDNTREIKGYKSPFLIHPGETIREAIDYSDLSQTELSKRMDLSEKTVSLIVNGQAPVTTDTALKMEAVLGLSPELILNMQVSYELDKARLEKEKEFLREKKYLSKYSSCYSELVKHGYIESEKDPVDKVKSLLAFFGVDSLSLVKSVFAVAFRRSRVGHIDNESVAGWLRVGEIEAEQRGAMPFNDRILKSNLPKMRSLTKSVFKDYSKRLIELFAEAGVILVYTPYFKNTRISGAMRWLSPSRPIIQLSSYTQREDSLWFSLFHEVGHLLRHSKKDFFIDLDLNNDAKNKLEEEANRFAEDIIIPPDKMDGYKKMIREVNYNNLSIKIKSFAESIDIDPGIIAGRLGQERKTWKNVEKIRKKVNF